MEGNRSMCVDRGREGGDVLLTSVFNVIRPISPDITVNTDFNVIYKFVDETLSYGIPQ